MRLYPKCEHNKGPDEPCGICADRKEQQFQEDVTDVFDALRQYERIIGEVTRAFRLELKHEFFESFQRIVNRAKGQS